MHDLSGAFVVLLLTAAFLWFAVGIKIGLVIAEYLHGEEDPEFADGEENY